MNTVLIEEWKSGKVDAGLDMRKERHIGHPDQMLQKSMNLDNGLHLTSVESILDRT